MRNPRDALSQSAMPPVATQLRSSRTTPEKWCAYVRGSTKATPINTPMSENTATFLVLAEHTHSEDGGHVRVLVECAWVRAPAKRVAAAAYAKRFKTGSVVSVRVLRVLGTADWGREYFPLVDSNDVIDDQKQK